MQRYSHIEWQTNAEETIDHAASTPLHQHLRAVGTAALSPDDAPHQRQFLKICGGTHDLGKVTDPFQEYLRGERVSSEATHHADISALATYYALEKHDFEPTVCLRGWFIVDRHHTGLINVGSSPESNTRGLLETYTDASSRDTQLIAEKAIAVADQWEAVAPAFDKLGIDFDPDEFVDWIGEDALSAVLEIAVSVGYEGEMDTQSPASAYRFINDYGRLIAADRQMAASLSPPERRTIPTDAVDTYIDQEYSDPEPNTMDDLRETARQRVRTAAQEVSLDDRLYRITLPTGGGKTMTGMDAALQLRNRVVAEQEMPPRIVYALPFTAIIDQNYAVWAKILDTSCNDLVGDGDLPEQSEADGRYGEQGVPRDEDAESAPSLPPELLLKHHYLSRETYHGKRDRTGYDGGAEMDIETATHLTDRWESEVITTTFIQLFESLLTPAAGQALKLSNLEGAIVILDELQAIPVKYWEIVAELLTVGAQELNLRCISMTATQPPIFDEATELVPSPDHMFNTCDRVQFELDASISLEADSLSFAELTDRVVKDIRTDPDADILVVANTVSSAQTLYHLLDERRETDTAELLFLSSSVRPVDRQQRVAQLTNGETESQRIVVSTQVVEAGVDMDMDIVYRDFAPLDAIVQTAGRCERETLDGDGRVSVIATQNDTGTNPGTYIYKSTKLAATRTVLSEIGLAASYKESVITKDGMERYYDILASDMTRTDDGLEALHRWRFDDAALTLIEELQSVSLYIPLTQDDWRLLDNYEYALREGDSTSIRELRPAVQERIVSVIVESNDDLIEKIEESPDIYKMEYDDVFIVKNPNTWYHTECGIDPPDDTIDSRIIG